MNDVENKTKEQVHKVPYKELVDDDDQHIKQNITSWLDDFYDESSKAANEDEDIDTNEKYKRIIDNLIAQPPKEYDTEDEIARGLLNDLKGMIKQELESKEKSRKILTRWLLGAFTVLGIFVIVLTFVSYHYDTKVVLAVISGFFVNIIGLVIILLKYMFSPSKELYDYTLGIFKRKNGN